MLQNVRHVIVPLVTKAETAAKNAALPVQGLLQATYIRNTSVYYMKVCMGHPNLPPHHLHDDDL